jgi:hypothetical protein
MQDRSKLKDYITPERNIISESLQISKNSIIVADKEIPAVIYNSDLNITKIAKEKINVNNDGEKDKPKKVKDNQMIIEKLGKYMKIMEYYGINFNEHQFIH